MTFSVRIPGAIEYPSPFTSGVKPPRVPTAPPRIILHTTETPPGTGRTVANRLPWPYHALYEYVSMETLQLLDLDRVALSLEHPPGTIETNHMGICIQISIVGYAGTLKRDLRPDSRSFRHFIQQVMVPIMQKFKVQNHWMGTYEPNASFILASTASPIRLSAREWQTFHGVAFHQHVINQSHWDTPFWEKEAKRLVEGFRPVMVTAPDDFTFPGLTSVVQPGSPETERRALFVVLNSFFRGPKATLLTVESTWSEVTLAIQVAQAVLDVEADGYWGPVTGYVFKQWYRQVVEAVGAGMKGNTKADAKLAATLRDHFQELRELKDALEEMKGFGRTLIQELGKDSPVVAEFTNIFTRVAKEFNDSKGIRKAVIKAMS